MGLIQFDIIRRANSTGYSYGDLVAPSTLNDHVYKCTTPGTSGASPPTWNTGTGSTTSDGSVVWTECNPSGITYAAVLAFTHNPRYGDYRRTRRYVQPIDYSDGGDPYVYDKGLSARNERTLVFDIIPASDLTKLLEFIEIVRGRQPFSTGCPAFSNSCHRGLLPNYDPDNWQST